jgi:site-specific DNA recombinase
MTTTGANKNVALVYVRVSRLDAKDADRKLSPKTQVEQCAALPAVRGLTVEVFEDLNVSGKNTQRPGFQRMLARLDRGDVAVIAAYSLSRISRSVADFYRLYEGVLRPRGVAFVSATESIDTSTPQGRAFMGMTAVWAQMEREVTGDRVADNLASKAATGALVGPLPAGYTRTDRKVELDPPAAAVVRTIFKDYARGTYSFRSLARALNLRGLQPPEHHHVGRGARPAASPHRAPVFTADSIKDILSNERYAGRIRLRDGAVIAGNYPAIIDAATFDACEGIRARHRFTAHSGKPGAGKRASTYVLSGVLRCAECGSTMSGHTRTPDRIHREPRYSYVCYRRRVAGGCSAPPVQQEPVEADLLAVLRTMALPPGFAKAVDRAVAARLRTFSGAQTVSAEALASRQARLNEMYEVGRIGRDEYEAKCREIDEQRARLAERPAPLFQQQQSILRSLVDEWDGMTTDERRKVLAGIFDSVTATSDGIDRLEPCEDWRPYVVAAIPGHWVPTERKTGLEPATPTLARLCSTN